MDLTAIFLIGLGITFTLSITIMLYLRAPLYRVLLDLYQSETQARFWTINSHVLLVLVPLFFTNFLGMLFPALSTEKTDLTFLLSAQLAYSLIGLIGTIVIQSLIIRRSIIRYERSHPGK